MPALRSWPGALAAWLILLGPAPAEETPIKDLSTWKASPDHFLGVAAAPDGLGLESGKWRLPEAHPARWGYALSPVVRADLAIRASVTITRAARSFAFFGQSWSVWPDHTYGDQGFDAGVLVRAGTGSKWPTAFGYRIQLSHKYQCVALVKYPNGGYLRVAPCEVKLNQPHRLEIAAQGQEIRVRVDGQEKVRFHDAILPLDRGQAGVGVSSGAMVVFRDVAWQALPPKEKVEAREHEPRLSVRKWLGDRSWVFDGDEPIMLLPTTEASYINNVKLRPGYKPQLGWNSHWDIQNQGAFPEGTNRIGPVTTSGGGTTLTASWTARQTKDRFITRTVLTIGWDAKRSTYRYDVDGMLEVLPGEPFHFRYGYDFEHHTPLDPFNWQYLVVQREGGKLAHRPVYPIDPGPMHGVEAYQGLRLWYGRHNEPLLVAPAVEYHIDPLLNRDPEAPDRIRQRKLNTAVCAAFYDTGVSFEPETARPGTKVSVKYRYTGYPADEARRTFEASNIYPSPTLDPEHHWIFADEWPRLTFRQFVPLSQTWQYGRTPFRGNSANSVRPNYYLARDTGVGSGFAMRLGPLGQAEAHLPIPAPLTAGRYAVKALCKSINAHGPGGRIDLKAASKAGGKELLNARHYVGNGTFDWKTVGFAFELPGEASTLRLGLGNGGTGDVLFTDVEFICLAAGAPLPAGVLPVSNGKPPQATASPRGAIADYRLVEGQGLYAFDFARGPFGLLELANLDWVTDEGRSALRFADNPDGRKRYPRDGTLDRNYFGHGAYKDRHTVAVALAGHHGGGSPWSAFTLATSIKPAAQMGKTQHGGKGDILGIGGRRFILGLHGQKAPYQLEARLNVNDLVRAGQTSLEANRWYHVAMTGEPAPEKKWRIRLYLDGQFVQEGVSRRFEAPATIPPSLILGAEVFYLHDAWYRGLIGRTLVFDRVLGADEIATMARDR